MKKQISLIPVKRALKVLSILVGYAGFVASAESRVNDDQKLTLYHWVRLTIEKSTKEPIMSAARMRISSAKQSISAFKSNQPWSLGSTLSQQQSQPINASENSLKSGLTSLETKLGYTLLSSLAAELKILSGFTDVENVPGVDPEGNRKYQNNNSKTHSGSIALSYDLMKGGENGELASSAKFQELSSREAYWRSRQTLADLKGNLSSSLLAYIGLRCKELILRDIATNAVKTRDIAKIKVKARTMSRKDLLNFERVNFDIIQRLAINEAGLSAEKLSLELFGDSLIKVADSFDTEGCKSEPVPWPKGLNSLADIDSLNKFVRKTRNYRLSEIEYDKSKITLRSSRLTESPSLIPFVSAQWAPKIDGLAESGSLTVGIRFNWDLPSGSSTMRNRSAVISMKSALLERATELIRSRSSLKKLRSDWENQSNILEIVEKSNEVNRELLKAVETELNAGLVDSITYVSTTTAFLEGQLRSIDLRTQIVSTVIAAELLADKL
jgi:hypothetical protein